jgi:ribonuclease/clavin/mitogillin
MSIVLEPNNILFSGDCILGIGTAVFDELYTYMASLKMLLEECKSVGIGMIYPGHGPVVEKPQEKIIEYINHRGLREKQITEVFQKNKGNSLTSLQVSFLVYGKLPIQNMASAQWNVLHHLEKLAHEKIIQKGFLDFWTLP